MENLKSNLIDIITLSEGQAPSRVKLFNKGITKTKNGDYLYNESMADYIYEQSHSVEWLPIDVNHLSFISDNPMGQEALGWFKLEFNEEGMWASEIEWTDEGRKKVESKALRYTSPTFMVAEDGMTITRIMGVSLTNNPATIAVEPLVAKELLSGNSVNNKEEIMATEEENKVEVSEEVATQETEAPTVAELKELLAKLEAEKEESEKKLEEIRAEKAELEAEHKSMVLASYTFSAKEKEFWTKKSLTEIKEYLSIKKEEKVQASDLATAIVKEMPEQKKVEKEDFEEKVSVLSDKERKYVLQAAARQVKRYKFNR